MDAARLLPRPGPVWGAHPLRGVDDTAPPARRLRDALSPRARPRGVARAAAADIDRWHALDGSAQLAPALATLRRDLRRDGLTPANAARALAAAAAAATVAVGQTPRPTQLHAAAVLLDLRFAEMATGEGKTLALALAAAAAGLAGVTAHVVTANDYLAARDAAALAPLYARLGLTVAALPVGGPGSTADDAAERRAAYACDVVYATARELAFDHLRDRVGFAQRSPAERAAAALAGDAADATRQRGLAWALLDEADSILLDEAEVPLILSTSRPHAARRAFLWQALALARRLAPGRDFAVDAAARSATLSATGEDRIAELARPLGGPWQRPRYRREAVQLALVALHACRRDAHYVVRDGAVELLDEVTGRIAAGRVWSRGLHTVVALKEGLAPPDETETVAQITFQRFFQRYWRVSGLSGTLAEARGELRAVLGARVERIALHRKGRLVALPPRVFTDAQARWQAVARRVAELHVAGRPVLVGTDSVGDSAALSQVLAAAPLPHRVLNALHDADEAAIVAAAGRAGAVTVATRMAGRGTDIALDAAARAAGGLHVLSCQRNPSRRLDRQLAGRAARHGEPGSVETWHLTAAAATDSAAAAEDPMQWTPTTPSIPSWLRLALWRATQTREERRRARARAELLRQDRLWERRLAWAAPAG